MPILSAVGRASSSHRLTIAGLYAVLAFFGATMAAPFLITLTSSASNEFDYDRYALAPRSLWSSSDRFGKGLVCFFNRYPGWYQVLQQEFPSAPANWTRWRTIGLDQAGVDAISRPYLHATEAEKEARGRRAADYAEFSTSYRIDDTLAAFTGEEATEFISRRYRLLAAGALPPAGRSAREAEALRIVSERWGIPVTSFFAIRFDGEERAPLGQQSWAPPQTEKQADYLRLKEALRHGLGTPGVLAGWEEFLRRHGYSRNQAEALSPLPDDASPEARSLWIEYARVHAPASPVIPYPMRLAWFDFLKGEDVREQLRLAPNEAFDIARYNALAGTAYASLHETPFPLPADGFSGLRPLWDRFVAERYPLRLVRVEPTPELRARYRKFLDGYADTDGIRRLLGPAWKEDALDPLLPAAEGRRELWADFVKALPHGTREIDSSEAAYQRFLLAKYGSLGAINGAYGWHINRIEEAFPPLASACAVTYLDHSTAFAWEPLLANYRTIGKFLLEQGNSIPVTLWLIVLSIFMTWTVNPIAGYALSRFNLRNKDKIILFCLATAAFPAMVSAIPGYLLMRDLGMLNTFIALVLPGAANGMGIFILKGFFDSLPQELYEAATIDGAKEWQVFWFVTLPMVKPIMALNALNSFIAAYAGWEWALIICQKQSMWTVSVWLYQASQWWAGTPWITTAGFVVASLPTLVVFLLCQNVIMKGIIVPSMK